MLCAQGWGEVSRRGAECEKTTREWVFETYLYILKYRIPFIVMNLPPIILKILLIETGKWKYWKISSSSATDKDCTRFINKKLIPQTIAHAPNSIQFTWILFTFKYLPMMDWVNCTKSLPESVFQDFPHTTRLIVSLRMIEVQIVSTTNLISLNSNTLN